MYRLERIPLDQQEKGSTGGKGGPKGLGDPNDTSLRQIERDVLIPEMMREKLAKNQCLDVTKNFYDCAEKNGILIVPRCTEHRDKLVSCMSRWIHDPEYIKETTKEYLAQRSEYRRTGIPVRKSKRMSSGVHS